MAFKKKKKVLGEWRCYKNKIDLLFDLYSYYLMNNIYIVLRIILFQSCFCDATSPNTFFFLKAMIMITQGQESKHQLYPALPPLFTNQQLRLLFCQNKTAPRHRSRSLSPLHLFSPETNCLTTKLSLVTKIDHIVLVHSTKLAPVDLPHKKGKTCTSFELPHKKVKV